jgi:hypothetical protein
LNADARLFLVSFERVKCKMAIKTLADDFKFDERFVSGLKTRATHNWDAYCDGKGHEATPADWGGAKAESVLALLLRHACARGLFLLYRIDKKVQVLQWRAVEPRNAAEVAWIRKCNAASNNVMRKGQVDPTLTRNYPWMEGTTVGSPPAASTNGAAHEETSEEDAYLADEFGTSDSSEGMPEEAPEPEPTPTTTLPKHLQGNGGRKHKAVAK